MWRAAACPACPACLRALAAAQQFLWCVVSLWGFSGSLGAGETKRLATRPSWPKASRMHPALGLAKSSEFGAISCRLGGGTRLDYSINHCLPLPAQEAHLGRGQCRLLFCSRGWLVGCMLRLEGEREGGARRREGGAAFSPVAFAFAFAFAAVAACTWQTTQGCFDAKPACRPLPLPVARCPRCRYCCCCCC